MGELFSYKTLVKAISGAVGSTFSLSVFYPLDLLRTQLQVGALSCDRSAFGLLSMIAERDGVSALYKGIGPNLVALGVSNFIYFYTFHGLKHLWPESHQDATKDSIFSYIAGTINVLLTTPLWMASVRLKLQQQQKNRDDKEGSGARYRRQYSGLIDCLTDVAKHEGVAGLWRGVIASILLVFNPSIQFTIYEALKRHYLMLFDLKVISGPVAFLLGAIAKFLATVVTYPLQVVQSRQRSGRNETPKHSFQVLMDVFKESGVRGLFYGLEAKLYQTVLTAALMFLTYEKLVQFIFWMLSA